MTKDRVDHKPHLSLLSPTHILAGPLPSAFEMITSHAHGFWETGHYSNKTLFNSREQENNGLYILKRILKNRAQGLFWRIGNIKTFLDSENNATK